MTCKPCHPSSQQKYYKSSLNCSDHKPTQPLINLPVACCKNSTSCNTQAPAKRVQHFIKHHKTFDAHCCMLFDRVQQMGGQTNATFHTTLYNISSKMSTTEYNKVALGGQTNTTSCNIPGNKRNVVSYNIHLVKKFDCDQTSYNKIQHNKTRYNKVAK